MMIVVMVINTTWTVLQKQVGFPCSKMVLPPLDSQPKIMFIFGTAMF